MSRVILKALKEKKGLNIAYGFADTPHGEVLLAWLSDKPATPICHLHFVQNSRAACVPQLLKRWPQATAVENTKTAQQLVKRIFIEAAAAAAADSDTTIEVSMAGTAFQQSVWQALVQIPAGSNCTYSDVAERIDKPKAVRAVANAVANNEVAVLIPCHRVVAKNGNKFKYRWGAERKRKLLEDEEKAAPPKKDIVKLKNKKNK